MSGLRFESMADMPPRMRELYARQQMPGAAAAPKKASKYHSTPAERGELRFDSQKEARRYDELMVMLRAGIISDLRLQQQFTLQESYMTETGERIRAVRYTADFSYKFGSKLVVEDVKSAPTRTKRIEYCSCYRLSVEYKVDLHWRSGLVVGKQAVHDADGGLCRAGYGEGCCAKGIGNQPGNYILSDLCRRRSAMRRLRKETPALHPAHGKSLKPVRRESA